MKGGTIGLGLVCIAAVIGVFIAVQTATEPSPSPATAPRQALPETTGSVPVSGSRISLIKGFARPASAGTSGTPVYFTLANTGPAGTLVGVSSPRARSAQLRAAPGGGALTAIEIPANGVLSLESGGRHVLLGGIEAPLIAGEDLPLVLEFGDGGRLATRVPILDHGL